MIRIPTRTHGIMDLVASAALMAAPFMLKSLGNNNNNGRRKTKGAQKRSNTGNIENILLPAIGAGILAQGLMTNFELGAVKAVGMRSHLTLDLGLGAFMIAAPFILNLDERLKVPMIAMGAVEIGLALITQTESSYEQLEGILDDSDSFIEEISHIL